MIVQQQQRFKIEHHEVYTEELNKIALSSNYDKRLQTFDRITYPHRTNTLKVCQSEMMIVREAFVENYADCPFYGDIVLQSQQIWKITNVNINDQFWWLPLWKQNAVQ